MADDREIQQALKECEAKFLKLFRESPLLLLLTNAKDDHYIEVNDAFIRRTGWTREEVIGRSPSDIDIWVDSSERVEFMQRLSSQGNVGDFKLHGRMENGDIRTGSASAALIEVGGEPCMLTLIEDTTDLQGAEKAKQVAERLSRAIRVLLQAHEEEHASIVRELHKYLDCLSLLSVGLDHLHHMSLGNPYNGSASVAETRKEIGNASKLVEDLFNDIRVLSHRLHSPKLEYLGLPAAAASFCTELSTERNIPIEFASEGVPQDLPQDVSLVLSDVLQEALENAVTHSGSERIQVLLNGAANQLDLTVRDWGSGFIPEEALNGDGIGLTLMQERLKIVNGELSIESQAQRGTTIHVRVPLTQKTNTATSA